MRYGISIPPFAEFADVRLLADLAREAEAAGWEGFFPIKRSETFEMLTSGALREVVAYTRQHRTSDAPFDVVVAGQSETNGEAWPAGSVADYREAGATWWLEDLTPWRFGWEQGPWPVAAMRERVLAGPPRI